MPWTLLMRLLTGVFLTRLARSQRRGGAAAAFRMPSGPTMRARARDVRDTASLATRVVTALVFGVATVVVATAGTSTAVLSPRWLGAALLVVAAIFAALTIREARAARALVRSRRLRRRDRQLRREV